MNYHPGSSDGEPHFTDDPAAHARLQEIFSQRQQLVGLLDQMQDQEGPLEIAQREKLAKAREAVIGLSAEHIALRTDEEHIFHPYNPDNDPRP